MLGCFLNGEMSLTFSYCLLYGEMSLSMVKCLLLFTRFCQDEISSRVEFIHVKKTGMKFYPRMKKRQKDV